MKRTCLVTFALVCGAAGYLAAQDVPSIKVEIKDPKVTSVQSPQFQVGNVPAKPYRPKNWMEIDIPFDVKKAPKAGVVENIVDSLEFRLFVVLNKMDKNGKRLLLSGTLTVLNVPLKEKAHLLVYVSPATLTRTLEKSTFSEADIADVGIEVLAGGATVGAHSKLQKKWWDNLDAFATMPGGVLPKSKTPFASLWPDYDVEVKQ